MDKNGNGADGRWPRGRREEQGKGGGGDRYGREKRKALPQTTAVQPLRISDVSSRYKYWRPSGAAASCRGGGGGAGSGRGGGG